MQALTSLVLATFVAYIGAWYVGLVEGNFALLLFLATLVTGIYWLAERFYFLPQRQHAAAELEVQTLKRNEELSKLGISQVDGNVTEAKAKLLAQPWWLDWTAGLFPVIIAVFVLRSFLFEPFKIPSGSMIPTLLVGDLILVNKFEYGLRLPVLNTKITEGTAPKRGDVMVFRYPPKPSLDYIKRVVGVPGDEVAYLNKRLTINGKVLETNAVPEFFDEDSMRYFKQFEENLGSVKHRVLNDDSRPAFVPGADEFQFKQNCQYSVEGVVCKVPEGHYFMMGDNRDNSLDSRYWGFVPDKNIVGKAFFVWMNFGNLKRIGSFN
ncbi:signal peptidase I [Rhodoferax fermentans]|uniref:Signal peptidase I n=1 Tax=Rhodoferax fermentans TaxID=28066 RepID=A0A1T1AQA5_RHOFE|nr:signal peptidase I [Rhodoferax fermentans]MBK1683533.1 signal peptidase I [Rhodoferax fermentans]OOV06281.1 S26 family signal peptidase [Rhodoferax fermentans]